MRALGYEERDFLLRTRYTISLSISGDPNRSVQTSVCLVHGSSSAVAIPVVQTTVDPDPQIVASAIATFQYNNWIRARLGQEELESAIIPCIAIIGTRLIFYFVPITEELSQAVLAGQYPIPTTLVRKCVAVSDSGRLNEGMESLDFRRVAVQHYITFHIHAMCF